TIWHTAWLLDQGERARHESSMAKVICSEAIWRVVDRSMQVLGRLGITDDTIVARLFREVRPFRIYDGPSEVHRWSIAQRVLRTGGAPQCLRWRSASLSRSRAGCRCGSSRRPIPILWRSFLACLPLSAVLSAVSCPRSVWGRA